MRHALRRLLASPVFALTAIVTLGAAIGANALIFSMINGVLLKPLPFANPDRLVGVWHVAPGLGIGPGPMDQSPSTYFAYRDDAEVFEDIGLWDNTSVTVTGRGEPEELQALLMTDAVLPLIGTRPVLGRTFTREDDSPAGPTTVILGYRYWQRAFGANPAALGQSLVVDGRPRQVIGVLPEDFRFLRYNPSVVLPFRFNRAETFLGNFSYQGVARLKPGVTLEQANADIARIIPTLPDRFPPPPGSGFTREMFDSIRLGPLVRPLAADVIGDVGPMLWILLGTVGVLLLVACANVANLFLVRAESRQQELAIRTALGAGRGRIMGQLLSEAMLLGLAGGVLGLLLAGAGVRLLVALEPANLPRLEDISIDPIVLVFTLALALGAGLVFGLVPMVKFSTPRIANALKEGGRGSSDGRERHRARNSLVVAQVAMALVLLVASGLMIRTFAAMKHVSPGFTNPEQVLTVRISVPKALVDDPAQVARIYEQIAHGIEAVPGVTAVGLSSSITMDGYDSNDPIFAEDFPPPEGQIPPLRRYKWISGNTFHTLGNRIVAGRDFTWADIHEARPVVIISENLAREIWGEPAKAVGRRVRNTPSSPWREVVGVVGTELDDGVAKPAPAIVYWPLLVADHWGEPLRAQRSVAYAIRSERLQSPDFLTDVQRAVWSVNPNLPLARVQTLQEIYDDSLAQTSFAMIVLATAAGVTLLLGLVGLYGVIAYIVAQRRREVGIRMVLGASRAEVQRLFLTRGLALTGTGIVIGLGAAAAVMRLLSSQLFGVTPFDPVTYLAVVVTLGGIALFATWVPARQATKLDPAIALRSE